MNELQRIKKVMEMEHLNAKQFCAEVGISQSTLSNMFRGRNKPSLDVMQAILNRFRTIQSDWLILNIGSMYRPNGDGPQMSLFDVRPEDENTSDTTPAASDKPSISSDFSEQPAPAEVHKQVKKIVVFYTDGTYEER